MGFFDWINGVDRCKLEPLHGLHKDEIVSQVLMPSAVEQGLRYIEHADPFTLSSVCRKKLVTIFRCTRCDRIKIHTEVNP